MQLLQQKVWDSSSMTCTDMDNLISNIPSIKELSDECKTSILIEVFVKKCPGGRRGLTDGSGPLLYPVETEDQIDLTVLAFPPLLYISLFVYEILELNPGAQLTQKIEKDIW